MIEKLKAWFLNLVTEADNSTHSLPRWMGLGAFGYFHAMTLANVFHLHQAFDMTAYGTGLGALMATVGVMIKLDA